MSDESIAAAILKGLREAKTEILYQQEYEREMLAYKEEKARRLAESLRQARNAANGMVQALESLKALPGSRLEFSLAAAFAGGYEAAVKITTNIPVFSAPGERKTSLEMLATIGGQLCIYRSVPEVNISASADKPEELVTYVARRAVLTGLVPMPG